MPLYIAKSVPKICLRFQDVQARKSAGTMMKLSIAIVERAAR
jgi:hypothetical protein